MRRRGQNVLVKFGIDAYDGDGKKLDPEKINWSSGCQVASRTSSSRARTTRSASSRSTSTTRTPSTCTTRPRRRCSGAISARQARDACACRASSSSRLGCLADTGLDARANRPDERDAASVSDVQAEEAGAALFRLHHGMGDGGRRRPVPPRPLSQGRHRPHGRGVLTSGLHRSFTVI